MDILQDQAFVADLQFLSTVHEDVAAEFAYTAANTILRRDLKPPNFARAAKELQVSVQTVEASVRALSHLYLHAASKLIPADKLTAVLGGKQEFATPSNAILSLEVDQEVDARGPECWASEPAMP
eukprot:jgi/Mesen1/3399/ME000192S02562